MNTNLPDPNERLLLRLPEAAAMLGIGLSTIYELLGSGELPVVRVGRGIRVSVEAVQQWIKANSSQWKSYSKDQ